jgi:hypothetical protein
VQEALEAPVSVFVPLRETWGDEDFGNPSFANSIFAILWR